MQQPCVEAIVVCYSNYCPQPHLLLTKQAAMMNKVGASKSGTTSSNPSGKQQQQQQQRSAAASAQAKHCQMQTPDFEEEQRPP